VRNILTCLTCLLLVACGTVKDENPQPAAPDQAQKAPVAAKHPAGIRFHPVKGLSNKITGNREVMKASVNGREIVAVLAWRPYRADLDGKVATWYGDMTRPPPRFVVESLALTVDGTTLTLPKSRTRSLCSQRATLEPQFPKLALFTSGSNLGLTVGVGDGAESWTSSYLLDPAPLSILSHQVEDGPTFDNFSVEY
ncbi:MAG TPA: hypothetical protein DCS85_05925, partial [Verrucomicrobiales bacterium]|nr:hypothetical protein [Verrucomicrobiales bacterium]